MPGNVKVIGLKDVPVHPADSGLPELHGSLYGMEGSWKEWQG